LLAPTRVHVQDLILIGCAVRSFHAQLGSKLGLIHDASANLSYSQTGGSIR
jgi:hypothetical protein